MKLERPIICLQISKVLDMKGPKFYLSKFEIERFITVVPPYVQFLFAWPMWPLCVWLAYVTFCIWLTYVDLLCLADMWPFVFGWIYVDILGLADLCDLFGFADLCDLFGLADLCDPFWFGWPMWPFLVWLTFVTFWFWLTYKTCFRYLLYQLSMIHC